MSVESRGVSTSRTSRKVTGPIADSGASSRSMRSTRSGLAMTRGASRSSALSQSPHDCASGQSAISARIGSANARNARSCSRSRTSARTRDASGSSELASRTRRSYSCSRPLRRRCQRSSRPITAASTIRSSHRQGARRVPARSRSDSPRAICAAASSSGWRIFRALIRRKDRFDDVVGRRRPLVGVAGFVQRHLAKRDVFGEAARRQLLVRAREQRKQRAARGIGPPGAAMEPRGNAGSIERMFEHTEIGLRRAKQDRHLIERHAALGFLQQAAGDLDRFAPFARRRKQDNGVVVLACGRRLVGENKYCCSLSSAYRCVRVREVRTVRCQGAPGCSCRRRVSWRSRILAAAITAVMNAASAFDPIATSSSSTVLSPSTWRFDRNSSVAVASIVA